LLNTDVVRRWWLREKNAPAAGASQDRSILMLFRLTNLPGIGQSDSYALFSILGGIKNGVVNALPLFSEFKSSMSVSIRNW